MDSEVSNLLLLLHCIINQVSPVFFLLTCSTEWRLLSSLSKRHKERRGDGGGAQRALRRRRRQKWTGECRWGAFGSNPCNSEKDLQHPRAWTCLTVWMLSLHFLMWSFLSEKSSGLCELPRIGLMFYIFIKYFILFLALTFKGNVYLHFFCKIAAAALNCIFRLDFG